MPSRLSECFINTYVFLLSAGVHSSSRAIQLDPYDPYHAGTLGLRVHGRQRGHLRHLPAELGHRAAHLHQSEQAYRPGKWLPEIIMA